MEKRLREILLKTRRRLLLEQRGEQPSPFAGEGLDFRELRPYTLDDDIRHLNWKSLARNRQPAVNVFNESRQINVLGIYLNSGGLAVGSPRSKKAMAKELITAIAYAAQLREDPAGALFFDEESRGWEPPSRQRVVVDRIYERVSKLEPRASVDYPALCEAVHARVKKRSVLFLIGDFMEFPKLDSLAARHELYCLVLRDKLDEELPLGEYVVEEGTSGRPEHWVIDEGTRRRYRDEVARHDTALAETFRRLHIGWEKFYTHEDAIDKLIRFTRRPE